ncbi:peptidoglycan DD-metalloendopeptidase family protein [Colwellia ponticola]|uniref:LysM peptidoglycan-binding domain-containing protein n=1 Tax=Colwellia ponticola TaxID=2304625 RepID=A0A8H2PM91_9GAMM|nr:peptidoglycan DD-metalloendopeptidase family protein [Colwellia ponticola]TMM46027.1 LysM peptidoglycan-binding domain-containing protein [Colwellia ponticola]
MSFFRRANALFFIFIVNISLSSCSSRDTPAPVTNIHSTSVLTEHNRNSIQSSQYFVKKGETLYSIAWRSNSDVRKIAQLNNISAPYNIYPGQKLFLTEHKVKRTAKASKNKAQHKKQTKSSTVSRKNRTKNSLASTKKQAYGENVNSKKSRQNSVLTADKSTSNFSQKISRWQWPVKGKVVEYFSNSTQGNKGIDIVGRRGTKIRSSAQGKVVYAGDALRGYGKLIIIKHNDDYLSAYAHNDRILVKEKQQINRGDVISTMGDTDANKVMLHFEIRFRGKSVNPLNYLPKNQ